MADSRFNTIKGKMMSVVAENRLSWHMRRVIILGVPMIASQLLQMAIAVTDSVMVGRLGELPLAQITLGTQFLFLFQLAVFGFPIAMSVVISNALGKNDERKIRHAMRMGLWQAVILLLIIVPITINSEAIFRALGQPEAAITGAVGYVNIALWALVPGLFLVVFRNYLIALERNVLLMVTSFVGFFANVIGNYVLIYGHWGFPALGVNGSAWATLFTHISMFVAVAIVVLREPLSKRVRLFVDLHHFDRELFMRLFRLGVPISLGLISEISMFQFATVMMGWIGVSELAAHGVVLQIASVTFMIPLGLSIVASVRAGNAMGRESRNGLLLGAKAALILATLFMVLTAIAFLLIPEQLIKLFLDITREDSARVIALGVGYMAVAAAFQIVDGVQVAVMGLLRGMQDTVIPAILAFIGYWMIGVSMSYVLAFKYGWAGQGVWAGMAIGLAIVALLLWVRFWWASRESRLFVDG